MNKVRIAQIGVSIDSHGKQIFSSLRKQSDIFEIAGYVFPENEDEKFRDRDLSCFGEYPRLTLEEVLEDKSITAVTVETEEVYLTKYALLAAAAGKHIHMEKPGSADAGSFSELLETVKKNGTVFHTGYMYRYNPFVAELMSDIKAGKLGKIISVDAAMSCYQPDSRYETLARLPGGMMYFLGCHLVDLVLAIMGEPKEVLPFNSSSGRHGDILDQGLALFRYDTGFSSVKTFGAEKGGYAERHLTVTGTEKTVTLRPLEFSRGGGLFTGRTVYSLSKWDYTGEYDESGIYDRYDSMMAAFASMVLGKAKNPYSPEYEELLFGTLLRCCGK